MRQKNKVNEDDLPITLGSTWFINKAEEILQNRDCWIDHQVHIGNEQFSLAQCLINADVLMFAADGVVKAVYDGTVSAGHLLETLKDKNHDYSDPNDCFSNFRMSEDFGISVAEGIKVRMCDKVSRIRRLTTETNFVSGETLLDAWLDLAGYILILSIYNLVEGDLTIQINEGTQL